MREELNPQNIAADIVRCCAERGIEVHSMDVLEAVERALAEKFADTPSGLAAVQPVAWIDPRQLSLIKAAKARGGEGFSFTNCLSVQQTPRDSAPLYDAAPPAQPVALPDGWVAVPREPTVVQVNAGVDADDLRTGFETVKRIYRAMLAAAPNLSDSVEVPRG